jgi:hypothetical protein
LRVETYNRYRIRDKDIDELRKLYQLFNGHTEQPAWTPGSKHGIDQLWLNAAIRSSGEGCAFYIIEKVYIGLFSKSADVGDRICIINGACVPMILRYKVDNFIGESTPVGSAGCYTFAGTAYVHGIINEEVISAVSRGKVAYQEIILVLAVARSLLSHFKLFFVLDLRPDGIL